MESPERPKLSFEELEAKIRDFKNHHISLPDEEIFDIQNKIAKYAKDLEEKYPDARKHRIFHVLIGSSENCSDMIKEDFPGEDSVESFIDNLLNQK